MTHHQQALLHQLQLRDELLLLDLQLVKSRRGLGPVSLEQVSVRLREGFGFLDNNS